MPRAIPLTNPDGEVQGHAIECPACRGLHLFNKHDTPAPSGASWDFNGDVDRPTFSPSMLATFPANRGRSKRVCHSFVRDGRIQFLNDCTHAMAGQTVDLPEIER